MAAHCDGNMVRGGTVGYTHSHFSRPFRDILEPHTDILYRYQLRRSGTPKNCHTRFVDSPVVIICTITPVNLSFS